MFYCPYHLTALTGSYTEDGVFMDAWCPRCEQFITADEALAEYQMETFRRRDAEKLQQWNANAKRFSAASGQ